MNVARHPHPICLWGMPGVGKSTVGAAFARKAELEYWDLDQHIEAGQGRDIETIIKAEGEKAFREFEKRTLWTLLDENAGVIALGGGALLEPGYRTKVRSRSTVITLWTSASELETRLRTEEIAKRPLLDVNQDMMMQLDTLLQKRERHYRDVDLVINVEKLSIEEITSRLEQHLAQGMAA